jgi:hypothetical protein
MCEELAADDGLIHSMLVARMTRLNFDLSGSEAKKVISQFRSGLK